MISLLLSALWAAVSIDRGILRPEASNDEIEAITLATAPSIGRYAAMIGLAGLRGRSFPRRIGAHADD